MASFTNMITAYTGLLALLTTNVQALHAHHRSTHKHSARQLVVPNADGVPVVAAASPTTTALPAMTAGNAAIADIQDIQSGLSDLPSNLLAYIQAVNDRLEEVETVLQGLVSSSSQPSPVPPIKESAPSATGWSSFIPPPPTPTSTSSSIVESTSSSTGLPETSSVIEAPAPYSTASGFDTTTTYTTRLTSTRTRTSTSTTRMPLATGTGTGLPYLSANGTTIAPSAAVPASGTAVVYPITLPLSQTFETTLRAAATPVVV